MDFSTLSRKDLQALCKKNKIPANTTNMAMAEALKALKSIEWGDEDCESEAKKKEDLIDTCNTPSTVVRRSQRLQSTATKKTTAVTGTATVTGTVMGLKKHEEPALLQTPATRNKRAAETNAEVPRQSTRKPVESVQIARLTRNPAKMMYLDQDEIETTETELAPLKVETTETEVAPFKEIETTKTEEAPLKEIEAIETEITKIVESVENFNEKVNNEEHNEITNEKESLEEKSDSKIEESMENSKDSAQNEREIDSPIMGIVYDEPVIEANREDASTHSDITLNASSIEISIGEDKEVNLKNTSLRKLKAIYKEKLTGLSNAGDAKGVEGRKLVLVALNENRIV